MKRFSVNTFARTSMIRVGALVVVICLLALVALSPFALRRVATLREMNWARLSDIGQTYGGVSALLTALALGGVVLSLLYQARDVSIAREQARRASHNELLKIELEDPFYMRALGAPWGMNIKTDYDSLRAFNFVNMWVSFWDSRYQLHEMSDKEIRYVAARELFNGKTGREYWSAIRSARLQISQGRSLRFARILDEEYHKALADGPPGGVALASDAHTTHQIAPQNTRVAEAGVIICVAVAGVLVGRLMGRRS